VCSARRRWKPYLGMVGAIQAVRRHVICSSIPSMSYRTDTLAVSPFAIVSPVPFIERLSMTDEIMAASTQCPYFGKEIGAIIPAEIGGVNSVIPLAVGRRLGLPVIDADGMGRAYPKSISAPLRLRTQGRTAGRRRRAWLRFGNRYDRQCLGLNGSPGCGGRDGRHCRWVGFPITWVT